jgi:hypothetical protein
MEIVKNNELYNELNKLSQICLEENANYKDILGKAFTLGYNFRNNELKTNILSLFENGK